MKLISVRNKNKTFYDRVPLALVHLIPNVVVTSKGAYKSWVKKQK
jgi:hypothetical protein